MPIKPRRKISSAESAIQQRPGWSQAKPWYELGVLSSPPKGMRVKLRFTHDQCRRHGIPKRRVQAHAAAGDGTLGREWVSTSPEGAAQDSPPLKAKKSMKGLS